MPDFTLESPDDPPTTVVTGSSAERARLVAQGYREVTDESPASEEEPPAAPAEQTPASRKAKTEAKAPDTETRNQ